MMNSVSILGVKFNILDNTQATKVILSACECKRSLPLTVVTPNPIMVMNAQENERLSSALANADLSLPDGTGIVSAARRIGAPLPERVTGIDTGYAVLERLSASGGSVYLLGADRGVAELAAKSLTDKLSGLKIVGTHHGYFENDEEIVSDVINKSPDLLILCLGSPRQEIWAHENKKKLSGVGAVICLGGALDVWSGRLKRAPSLFIKAHLEWLWRMILEPKRLKTLPKMIRFRLLTSKKNK